MDVLFSIKAKADGATQQLRCAVNGGFTIGRGPHSPLPLNGTGISREHLRFDTDGSSLAITDLSSNGTWVNGSRIPKGRSVPVDERTAIEVPGYEIRIALPVRESAPALPEPAQPPETAAPDVPGRRAAVGDWLRSFTFIERFAALVALLSIVLFIAWLRG